MTSHYFLCRMILFASILGMEEVLNVTQISGKSSFLFAYPSFTRGMARVLDLGATYVPYNQSESGDIADFKALRSDWLQVGEDIKNSMERYEEGQREE